MAGRGRLRRRRGGRGRLVPGVVAGVVAGAMTGVVAGAVTDVVAGVVQAGGRVAASFGRVEAGRRLPPDGGRRQLVVGFGRRSASVGGRRQPVIGFGRRSASASGRPRRRRRRQLVVSVCVIGVSRCSASAAPTGPRPAWVPARSDPAPAGPGLPRDPRCSPCFFLSPVFLSSPVWSASCAGGPPAWPRNRAVQSVPAPAVRPGTAAGAGTRTGRSRYTRFQAADA